MASPNRTVPGECWSFGREPKVKQPTALLAPKPLVLPRIVVHSEDHQIVCASDVVRRSIRTIYPSLPKNSPEHL